MLNDIDVHVWALAKPIHARLCHTTYTCTYIQHNIVLTQGAMSTKTSTSTLAPSSMKMKKIKRTKEALIPNLLWYV